MSWKSILKIVPSSAAMMPFVFTNKRQTEIFMDSVKKLTKPNKKLEGVMDNIASSRTSIEKIITDSNMLDTPHADLTMEEIKENYKTFVTLYWQVVRDLGADDSKNITNHERLTELKELVEEGNTARLAGDLAKVRSILSQIDDRNMVSRQTRDKDKSVAIKLKILRLSLDKPYLSFENLGSKKRFLPKLAELLGGELKGEVIFVDFTKQSDFQRAMTPETDEDGAFTEDKATLDKKHELREHWNEGIRYENEPNKKTGKRVTDEERKLSGVKFNFNSEGKQEELDIKLKDFDTFIGSNAKLSLKNRTFTQTQVFKYMSALEKKVGNSVDIWKPKKYPNGRPVHTKILFLDKSSSNSFNLNPYAKLLLEGGVFGDDWFTKLFTSIRQTALLSRKNADIYIIQNIVDAIKDNEMKSAGNLVSKDLLESVASLITNYEGKTKKTVKAEVNELYTSGGPLATSLNAITTKHRTGQMQELENGFTVKEALALQEWWKDEDLPQEELKITYLKDGVETRATGWKMEKDKKENYPVVKKVSKKHSGYEKYKAYLDSTPHLKPDGKPKYIPTLDSKGEKIPFEQDHIELANHATITAFDEKVTPKEVYSGEEGGYGRFKVSSGTDNQTPKKATAEKIKELKEEIARAKKDMASKHEQAAAKSRLDKLETNLKETEANLLTGTRRDIGEATSRFRHNLFNMSDFGSYILDLALKLKDEGGLTKLINSGNHSASALGQYEAEKAVVFYAVMAQQTNSDELGKAFKTIDDDPESDKAMATAKALNTNMLTILPIMKKEIIGAFKSRLEDFVNNPAQFPHKQVIQAKKALIEANLIKEGE
tara:strand:- start:984 stop:3470 length:2487 start_codon:yes stop_codon:yes gene_type:complete